MHANIILISCSNILFSQDIDLDDTIEALAEFEAAGRGAAKDLWKEIVVLMLRGAIGELGFRV